VVIAPTKDIQNISSVDKLITNEIQKIVVGQDLFTKQLKGIANVKRNNTLE
jgi:hypothetical protein